MRYGRDEPLRERRKDGSEQRTATAPAQPVERLLALQRSAGNRAVSELLARAPDTAAPADAKGAAASELRATLPGIGTIPLLSVSFDPSQRKGRGGEEAPKEIVVTSRMGPHSSRLSKAMLDGKAMDVEIVMPGKQATVRISLKGAIVSSYRTSGSDEHAVETWTLDFAAIAHDIEGEEGESDGGGSRGWDLGEARPSG